MLLPYLYSKEVYFTGHMFIYSSGLFTKSVLAVEDHAEHAAVTHIGGLFSPPVSQTTAKHQENIQGGRENAAAKKRV